jgi:type IV fimbrial biogenesis protein FimT
MQLFFFKFKQSAKGFSLVECLISLTIILLLSFFSVFGLGHLYSQQSMQSSAEEILGFLRFASLEAISHQHLITICPISQNGKCSYNWRSPVLGMFWGYQLNKSVRQLSIDQSFCELSWKGFGDARYIQFNQHGFPNGQNGVLKCKGNSGGWEIVINQYGRMQLKPTLSTGVFLSKKYLVINAG